MWIKNLIVYRLPASWAVEAEDLERKLAKTPLQRCGGFQMESRGWTCPFEEEQYLYNQNRHWLLALGMEEKLLPASIIRQEALDRAEKIAKSQAHPVGRKQMRDIREEVTNEFLPRALARRRLTHCWIDGINRWLVVDAAGDPIAEKYAATSLAPTL